MQKEYYYEIFSMGNTDGKKRHTINVRDFSESIEEGNIQILSAPRKA